MGQYLDMGLLKTNWEWQLAWESIPDGFVLVVTNCSYIKGPCQNLCSISFSLECTKQRGGTIGSFLEQTMAACTYRYSCKLLELMATHPNILITNEAYPNIHVTATVAIFWQVLESEPGSNITGYSNSKQVQILNYSQEYHGQLYGPIFHVYIFSC